jgi:Caspase domain
VKPRTLSYSFVAIVLLTFPSLSAAQTKRALLIGINIYTPEGTSVHLVSADDKQVHRPDSRFVGTIAWPNLDGPERDVESMAAVLPDFGFTEIHQLTGQKATRGEILAELDKYIIEEPKTGDTVLFYFAGHGSQRTNSKSAKVDHLDETIVPADAYRGTFDIRDKELARKFNRAIDKGVHLIAIFDSCHSGTMARGAKVGVARWLPYDDRDAADGGDYGTAGAPQPDPPATRGAIVISAALSTQTADEVDDENGGKAHGAFTAAFIRALRGSTPAWTTLDLVNSTDAQLKADGWTQQPTVEGPANRPLFGDFTVTGIRATVVKLIPPDQVTLNAGSAMGFGPDSEFESKSSAGTKVEVIAVTGPASSRARIISGKIDDVHPGDLVQITRLAVPPEAKLTIFVPGVVSEDEWNSIRDQVSKLQNGDKWSLVNDPVVELPSNLVYWTSAGWTITAPQGGSVTLGSTLTSDSISRVVTSGAKVYVSVPPIRAMIEALKQQEGVSSGAVDVSNSLAASQYILIGRLSREQGADAEYALILPGIFGAFDPASIVRSQADNKTVLCSTDSELPLRTDWVRPGTGHDSVTAATSEIEAAALKLGRDRAWLKTGAHNGEGSWPYRLVITQSNSGQPLSDTPLTAGSEYDVNLVADAAELASHAVQPQYVYLFGLQCDGGGTLLYPSAELGGGAPLPLLSEDERGKHYPERIKMAHLQVAPPVGLDTIVLLVTPERISDLSAFNYSGVVTRGMGARGVGNELDDLVRGISGRSRGIGSVAATWSIQRVSIKSH